VKTFDKNTSRCARGTVSGGVCVVCERTVHECRCGAVVGEPRESGEHEVHRGRTMNRGAAQRGGKRKIRWTRKSTIKRNNNNDIILVQYFFMKQNNDQTIQYAINIRKTLSR